MESMLKYVLFIILLLSAIVSTAQDTKYTAVQGDVENQIDKRCNGVVEDVKLIATIPRDMWPDTPIVESYIGDMMGLEIVDSLGSADDCIFVTMTCLQEESLDSCNTADQKGTVRVQVVGAVPKDSVEDDGNTVILFKDSFETLADTSASRVTVLYRPE